MTHPAGPLAAIAGAGIAGLTAALFLARSGWRVRIFEQAKALEEFGAGLQLSPNATRLLHRLDILGALAPFALEPERTRLRRARDGADLARLPFGEAARARWAAPYWLVHRADLQRVLLAAVQAEPAIELNLDCQLRGFSPDGAGVRIGWRRKGVSMSADADLLIGADGLRSAVRARLHQLAGLPEATPRDTRQEAWRATVPGDVLPALYRQAETSLWMGERAHLVHYPLRAGSIVNLILVRDLGVEAQGAGGWNQPGDPAIPARLTAGWAAEARKLVGAVEDWRTWPLFDLAPLPHYAAAPVALIGDAAHAMLPFLAQGAAQGIEDAAALADALARHAGMPAALAAYDSARRPRAGRIQEEARKQARIYHMARPLSDGRDLTMRLLGEQRLLARMDWIYAA